ncbi:MAG TPA: ribosome maturation factor RimM [Gammaproteobacteria bacterium]|nr:ribosome maturation factor RimM [Gammaproteobacteria bacterium]
MTDNGNRIVLGRVTGLFGVRGWVKVFSNTQPREGIANYSPWQLRLGNEWRSFVVEQGQSQGKGVIVKLEGVDDRDAAAALMGADIAIWREQLPPPAEGEIYWADLEGLEVVTVAGQALGRVSHLLETGANDVLVVRGERERLIPFVRGQVVTEIDLDGGRLVVDWDPDF